MEDESCYPRLYRLAAVLSLVFTCFTAGAANPPRAIALNETRTADGSAREIVFEIGGVNDVRREWKVTAAPGPPGSPCLPNAARYFYFDEVRTFDGKTRAVLRVPVDVEDDLFLCVGHYSISESGVEVVRWVHQGDGVKIRTRSADENAATPKKLIRKQRQSSFTTVKADTALPTDQFHISGIRVDYSAWDPKFDENGVPDIREGADTRVRLFGKNLNGQVLIGFAQDKKCRLLNGPYLVEESSGETAFVTIQLSYSDHPYHVCAKLRNPNVSLAEDDENFMHQGEKPWLLLRTHTRLLPVWATILICMMCLVFSALFSGLNLGLMSLDRTELKILMNTGTPEERRYARIISPVRSHGNYLLCSILLGNVLVNSTFTILLDDLTSGVVAVVCSTLAIVTFGEITPQAICSRHGLAVGAKTIHVTKLVMAITFPLAFPISKILDKILGEEIGNVYNRERLKELVKLQVTTDTNDLDKDEVNIISGALELRKKTVADVMTRIEDVFMLDYDSILDFETVSEIMKSGYSRIPVFEGNRNNIVTMLYIKDLAFVDPDDNTPLKTLCQFYQNPCNFVFEDVTLDVMFRQFKEGHKGHMAFVHRVNNEGEGDPFYETVGLITLEDVIEELIQAEIMDETDVITDNRSKRRRNADRMKDFTIFAERKDNQRIRISPQLTLATFQYLSTSLDPFKPDVISETILRRMLKQDIIVHIKKMKDKKHDISTVIYQQGKAVDFFVLILEGRVEVTVGKENLVFESGPFTYFGLQALTQNVGIVEAPTGHSNMGSLQSLNMDAMLHYTFYPDYTVRAVSDVLYMRVKRSLYMAAKRATLMERSQKDSSPGDQFDDEMEKIVDELLVSEVEYSPTQPGMSFVPTGLRQSSMTYDSYPYELLHSLNEDEGSIGRSSPQILLQERRLPSSNPSQNVTPQVQSPISSSVSPGGNSGVIHGNTARDINGSIRSKADSVIQSNEEEVALLSPRDKS